LVQPIAAWIAKWTSSSDHTPGTSIVRQIAGSIPLEPDVQLEVTHGPDLAHAASAGYRDLTA
jgi:hypothetical protein